MTPVMLGKSTPVLPAVLRWQAPDRPLPLRVVQVPRGGRGRKVGLEAPPWIDTGSPDSAFDFCFQVRRLCEDIARATKELHHIDVTRILFGITQARSGARHGLQARVTPLRFRHGHLQRKRNGVNYQVQRYFVEGREMLYLVTFCLPRFLDQSFDDKFITLFHELYHISPAFEGDLRRLEGRCSYHSHSKRAYDAHMAVLARSYLASGADPSLHAFLRLDFAQLRHRHGEVIGAVVPRPRLLPILDEE
ncbi:MAG: hypothetical protein U0840_07005 [Gemmataceae bacterium]